MAAYNIIGGRVSPNAIVIAPDAMSAQKIYNDWLELSTGRRDEGVGVYRLEALTVSIYKGGLSTYDKDVKGAIT
jgi:hypothetical protein